MAVTIAVCNQKGGVGKTTAAINLSHLMALADTRVLVVDLDPQGNTSSVLLPSYQGPSIMHGGAPQETGRDNLRLVPGAKDLLHSEKSAEGAHDRGLLKRALSQYSDDYDVIYIDCPPSLAHLPINALTAADGVLIPIQCEYYAMEGLGQILNVIAEMEEQDAIKLDFCRILLGMYDEELLLAREVAREVRDHLADQVLATVIPRDVALAAAPSHNHTIVEHDPLCPGAIAYLRACKEILNAIRR